LDKINGYRSKLLDELKDLIRVLGCEHKLCAMIGGAVGISIMPVENDKTQILELLEFKKINYFGDKYKPYPVDSPYDTKKFILDILG